MPVCHQSLQKMIIGQESFFRKNSIRVVKNTEYDADFKFVRNVTFSKK
jgi:hypothetical protein